MKKYKVILIEDNKNHANFIASLLNANNFDIKIFHEGKKAFEYLKEPDIFPDVILTDNYLQDIEGIEIIEHYIKAGYDYAFIILTGNNSIDLAVRALKAGALDYIPKSVNLRDELELVVEKTINRNRERLAKKSLEKQLKATNEILNKKNTQITSSINYARLIQEAILPATAIIKKHLPESFIFFSPKDIVSGDFYWFSHQDDKTLIAAVDCTGHGVPGAFMSMIGNTLLNDIVNKEKIYDPAQILLKLNRDVIFALGQGTTENEESEQNDGMDMTLCCIDYTQQKVTVACANHYFLIQQDNKIKKISGDIFSIGDNFGNNTEVNFTKHTFNISEVQSIYLFSDGYNDQFGGLNNKKFSDIRFIQLLQENHEKNMEDKHKLISDAFNDWKGDKSQIDDVVVIGIKF